jgi:hypothetical protein
MAGSNEEAGSDRGWRRWIVTWAIMLQHMWVVVWTRTIRCRLRIVATSLFARTRSIGTTIGNKVGNMVGLRTLGLGRLGIVPTGFEGSSQWGGINTFDK